MRDTASNLVNESQYRFGCALPLWACTKKENAWEANAIGIKAQLYRSVYRVFTLIYRRSPVYLSSTFTSSPLSIHIINEHSEVCMRLLLLV